MALGLAIVSFCYGVFALVWWPDGLWNPYLPWAGALPSLASAPFYVLAWAMARRRRLQQGALFLFVALFLVSILATWDRGAFCPAWYVQPVLASLATCCLGVMAGLTMTLVAVSALLLAAVYQPADSVAAASLPDLWTHTMSLAAVTLASALTGAVLHQLLRNALAIAEAHRRKTFDSSRALRYREKLLRHALRVETVGDLAGMVSHQLRNAFQVMMGHVSMGDSADSHELSRRLEQVGEMLHGSRPLLDQLMVLAHPEEGRPAPVDLEEQVARFRSQAAAVLPAAIAIHHERGEVPLPVQLDPRGLEHALWNLVINARHAIAGDGAITIATGRADGMATLTVADTGCGIPVEVQERIFDPYFTTKPPGQGTGLGLVAVARFVRGSNGRISFESRPERGTRFLLQFPLRDAPSHHPAASA